MAITSGFFDAVEHDRLYNAEDVGSLLDGIITDGILNTYGSHFEVRISNGLDVIVGSGRGWFKNTWIKNDDNLVLTAEANTSGVTRYDAVVIDINKSEDIRNNSILIVKGTNNTEGPTLIDEAAHKQYALAIIAINAAGTTIDSLVDVRDRIYATNPLVLKPYWPIGSIFMTMDNNFDPTVAFGGVWKQISGRFLIGCGGTSGLECGNTGGKWDYTLSINNLPSHNHSVNISTSGAVAEVTTLRLDDNVTGNSFMGWAQQTVGLPGTDMSNYLPADWNFRCGYNGVGNTDQQPVVANSIYATTQTVLTQSPHYHSVNGYAENTGGGSAITIKPPYLAVYMWKRVS